MTLVYGAMVVLLVTTIVTESYLFRPVRAVAQRVSVHLGVLLSCFLCFGTWVGFGAAWLIGGPLDRWYLDGLAYQGLALLLHAVLKVLDDLRVWLQR